MTGGQWEGPEKEEDGRKQGAAKGPIKQDASLGGAVLSDITVTGQRSSSLQNYLRDRKSRKMRNNLNLKFNLETHLKVEGAKRTNGLVRKEDQWTSAKFCA